jgi:hypothetical protein
MRRLVLGSLLSFACFACAQQPQPPMDVYESGGNAETPAQAVQKLYELAAEMSGDPSSGYDAKTDHWPEADAAWQQWDNSMGLNGNALTQQQRNELVPCAAHLGAAIDAAERSYRVQKSQPNNSAAQADAQKLLGTARSDFEQCNPADALNGSNGNPATGTASPGSPGNPLKGGVSTGPDDTPGATNGGGPGTPPATGTQPASPASPSSAPGSSSQPDPPASIQPTQDFRNKLLADAQTLLRNAGDISKAMTDRMNPATHNDVGVQVELLSLIGAAGRMMGLAAKEFQLLAAASRIAGPETTYLQIADTAASESTNLTNQIAQAETRFGTGGQAAAGAQPQNFRNYLQGMQEYAEEEQPALQQGNLPTCAVLSCYKLAQLLGIEADITTVFAKLRMTLPPVTPPPPGTVAPVSGITAAEIQNGLRSLGINAQAETGMQNLENVVRAGNPVIAGVFPTGFEADGAHALVIEALETRADVLGFRIYDPVGSVYWQPTGLFFRCFSNIFVRAH